MSFEFAPFSEKQAEVLSWWMKPDGYNGIIADGAIRSGKTLSMSLSFVFWAMSCFSQKNFAMCGKTIESFRRNVWTDLKTILLGEGFAVSERKSENLAIIRYRGKENRFYFFGGRDERSQDLIQGITLAGLFCDEVVLMPESFVNQATARCSVNGSKWWFNDNPEGQNHWFKINWIDRTKEKKLKYLHFTMEDNRSLSETIKERYRSQYDGIFYDRYILGLWKNAEGLVYPMFDEEKHSKNWTGYDPTKFYYVSVDYGTVNPFAICLFEYDHKKKTLLMVKDWGWDGRKKNKRKDNEAYYDLLTEGLKEIPRIQAIIVDPSAAGFIETIRRHAEYPVKKAKNNVLEGIQTVTKWLAQERLHFTPECKNTIREFSEYSWDEKSQKEQVIKENDHWLDSLRYCVMECEKL